MFAGEDEDYAHTHFSPIKIALTFLRSRESEDERRVSVAMKQHVNGAIFSRFNCAQTVMEDE